ncbi:hypothetical protein [Paenibacillus sp. RC67]|nr:hypothetical protein [Paenibacillus sp. RC67]
MTKGAMLREKDMDSGAGHRRNDLRLQQRACLAAATKPSAR